MNVEIKSWQYEDEMTEESMYSALYPLSKVSIVRLFPKEIEVKNIGQYQVEKILIIDGSRYLIREK